MRRLAGKIKRYWRLMLSLRRIGLINRMAYRVNFFIACFAVLLNMAMTIIFLKVIFQFVNNFSGWGYYQALVVVATFMLVDGLIWVFCACLVVLSNSIRDGNFDRFLVAPVDPQFLVSMWRGDGEDATRIITGLVLLFYAVSNLALGPWDMLARGLMYVLLVINASLIVYSVYLILRTFSFWFVEVRALATFGNIFLQTAQYPASIFYHKIAKLLVYSALPLAFIATVPAKILAYGFDWRFVAGSFLVAATFLFVSRQFWLYALRHYTSASS